MIRKVLAIAVGCTLVGFGGFSSTGASATDLSEDRSVGEMESYLSMRPVQEPVALSDPTTFSHVQDLRKAYGLSTSAEFVHRLHSDPKAFGGMSSSAGLLGGIVISAEELPHAYLRAAAEWVGGKVDEFAYDSVPGYAGTSVWPDATVVLYCSSCIVRETETEIRSTVQVDEPFTISVQSVAYSLADLQKFGESATETLLGLGVRSGGAVDVDTNSVTLHVPADSLELARKLLPAVVKVAGDFIEVAPDVNKNDALGYNLIEGGQYITSDPSPLRPNGTALTSGFAVQSAYGPFILTAGHYTYPAVCAEPGYTWRQGGLALGTMTAACGYGGAVDGALITTYGFRNNYGGVHWYSYDYVHRVTFGVTNHALVNQTVCQTGATTTGMTGDQQIYNRCGIVSSLSSGSPCGNASPAWTMSLGAASYVRASGDSGAGVVWPTGYGFGAAGTHSCVGFSGTGAIFSRFSVMASQWGLTITP